jgi:hypothetical protein
VNIKKKEQILRFAQNDKRKHEDAKANHDAIPEASLAG